MFEKWRIKEHMEVTDATGQHVGTVDEVNDGRIKLTRSDSSDGSHHYVDLDLVDRIDDNRVYLKEGANVGNTGQMNPAQMTQSQSSSPSAPREETQGANYAGSAGASTPPSSSEPLFGTSGHGTGMGGSGTT